MGSFLSAIVGVLIGAAISYFTVRDMFERQRFEKAASDFRCNLAKVFAGIYPYDMGEVLYSMSEWVIEVGKLQEKWPELLKAYSEFNYFVKDKETFRKDMITLLKLCKEHSNIESPNDLAPDFPKKFDSKIEKTLAFSEWHNNHCSRTKLVCNFIKNFCRC